MPPARALARSKLKPSQLVGHLDQAAGVHAVVGCVEDAALLERLLDPRVRELVVGRAADDPGRQHLDHVVGEGAAQGAGRVDVERRRDELVGRPGHPDVGVLADHPGDRRGRHVVDDDRGAVLDQQPDQVVADLPDAGDADGAAGERRRAPDDLGRGAHPLEHAVRRQHRRVAGAAVRGGAAGDEAALAGHHVHVVRSTCRRRRRCSSGRPGTARSGRRRAAAARSSRSSGPR